MELLIKKGIYSCVKWLMLLISLTAGLSAAASENMPDNFYRVTPDCIVRRNPITCRCRAWIALGYARC